MTGFMELIFIPQRGHNPRSQLVGVMCKAVAVFPDHILTTISPRFSVSKISSVNFPRQCCREIFFLNHSRQGFQLRRLYFPVFCFQLWQGRESPLCSPAALHILQLFLRYLQCYSTSRHVFPALLESHRNHRLHNSPIYTSTSTHCCLSHVTAGDATPALLPRVLASSSESNNPFGLSNKSLAPII